MHVRTMAPIERLLLPATLLLAVSLLSVGCVNTAGAADIARGLEGSTAAVTSRDADSVARYTYAVVDIYPHDAGAFTQGLAYDGGFLYEGTGRRGSSSLRRVELETGEVLQRTVLPEDYFGEGIAIREDRIVQLTWQAGVGLVYERNDFSLVREFTYDTEGWGLTYDGEHLIMSDGTSTLYFLDPQSFVIEETVDVHDGGMEVTRLNELEFIHGLVYANVWKTDTVAIIEPADGRVVGWLDLAGLLESQPVAGSVDVLNGIAYDTVEDRLFVTGKLWPWLFEIRLVPE